MSIFQMKPSSLATLFGRAALLLLLAGTPVAAQEEGTIRGTVVDVFGTALPGVRVTVTGTGVDAEDVTDVEGAFELTGPEPANDFETLFDSV